MYCFLKNVGIQDSLAKFPNAFVAFNRILDLWAEMLKCMKKAPITWDNNPMPVFQNTRQCKSLFVFTESIEQFNNIAEARAFADRLKTTLYGFSVCPSALGVGKSAHCEIVKTSNRYEQALHDFKVEKF